MQVWSSDKSKSSVLGPFLGEKAHTHKFISGAQNVLVLATLALFSFYLASAALTWGVEPYWNGFAESAKKVSDAFFFLGGITIVVTDIVAIVKVIASWI
jgi:hypothetical protein